MAYFCGNMLGLCLTAWPSGEVVSQKTINYYKKIDGEIVSASAAWSRDGKWIYFNSSPAGNWDIYRMHPDGSELQNLTADWPSDEIMPTAR
jgi:Tol biopolymer transport system component